MDSNIPSQITSGDIVEWSVKASDFSNPDNDGTALDPSAWDLTYNIRGPASLDVEGNDQGDGTWMFTIQSTDSALAAGDYVWQRKLTKHGATDAAVIDRGTLKILIDLSSVEGVYDGRSQARKDLEAIQATIRTMGTAGVARYSVAGRELWKLPVAELIMLESKLKVQVVREEKAQAIASGLGDPNSLYVRFK